MGKKQRERKAKDKARNAAKPSAQDETFVPFAEFLSPELAAECGEAAPAAPAARAAPEPRAKLSGTQRKRLAKYTEKARKRAQRAELYATLGAHAATPEQLGVVRATVAARSGSQRATARQRATAALLRDRHGLALDAAERDSLHARGATVDDADAPPVAPPPEAAMDDDAMDDDASDGDDAMDEGEHASDSDDDSDDDEAPPLVAPPPAAPPPIAAAPPAAPPPAAAATPSSFAAQMMAQLASLKTSALATAPATAAPAPEDAAPLAGRTGYVAVDLALPAALRSAPSAPSAAPAPARPRPAVVRPPGVAEARQALPCCGMEQELVDAVSRNDVVVVCGATGSGKSTQLPQFLYEAGLTATGLRIAVTQPRRVAAVTTCERVAFELGAPDPKTSPDALVGYRTRYDAGGVGPSTRLLFETDGVLLNECKRDLLLRDYAAVILDEAHERSLNTDVLLGLLSRAVPLRRAHYDEATAAGDADALPPLKLVVMSATLRVDDFLDNAALWGAGPRPELVSVEARQHPVTTHFAKVTELDDYAGAALAKTRAIHEKLPDGAVLVFLTGKREIDEFCDALRGPGLHVVPLHAQMSLADQRAAFEAPPPGCRKVVAATNVAETSLTIPGVTYVVDSGRAKRKVVLDAASGAVAFRVGWISRAAADQRAGRAGREGPGHCYRLYSSALFAETFDAFEAPEVARLPLLDVVLAAKDLGVNDVGSFPFPSRPPPAELAAAGRALERLGCVGANGILTPLGAAVARLPVGCRHACALAHVARNLGGADDRRRRTAALAVALVAAGSEACPFGGASDAQRRAFRHPMGDGHARLSAFGAYAAVRAAGGRGAGAAWCADRGLDGVALDKAFKLFAALKKACGTARVFAGGDGAPLEFALDDLRPATAAQDVLLAKALCAGSLDRVARRADPALVEARARAAAAAAGEVYDPKSLSAHDRDCAYELLCEAPGDRGPRLAYVSARSAAHARARRDLPPFLAYGAAALPERGAAKLDACTAVDGAWLAQLAGTFVAFGPPLERPPPRLRADGDRVRVFREPALAAARGPPWLLPVVAAPLEGCGPDAAGAVAARLLLDGALLPGLVDGAALLDAPAAALPLGDAPVAKRPPRVAALVAALRGAATRAAVAAALAAPAGRDALLGVVRKSGRAALEGRLAKL